MELQVTERVRSESEEERGEERGSVPTAVFRERERECVCVCVCVCVCGCGCGCVYVLCARYEERPLLFLVLLHDHGIVFVLRV